MIHVVSCIGGERIRDGPRYNDDSSDQCIVVDDWLRVGCS